MGKKFLRIILFFLIFSVLFGAFNHVMAPKNNSSRAGIHDSGAKGFLAEPENSLDALFLGDSEVYCCVIPLTIWEEQGITSYVCGSSDQKLYQAEDYLRRALETQSPKVVFLETNILYRDHSAIDVLPHRVEELFPLIRYHDRWKDLHISDFTDPIRFTSLSQDKGYVYKTEILAADDSDYMTPSDGLARIPGKNVRRMEKILDACQAHGAELILFSSPSTINWSSVRHNAVAQLAQDLDIAYIDMNLMQEQIPIDWQTDTLDRGDHMNYTGAQKVSAYLGSYLAERELFTDKRSDPAFSQWNDSLAAFRSTIAAPTT